MLTRAFGNIILEVRMHSTRYCVLLALAGAQLFAAADTVTFNKQVLPIFQKNCQTCHRPGEIGPMPLLTYEQARPWAKSIVEAVKTGKMPPWFADKCCGEFSTEHT